MSSHSTTVRDRTPKKTIFHPECSDDFRLGINYPSCFHLFPNFEAQVVQLVPERPQVPPGATTAGRASGLVGSTRLHGAVHDRQLKVALALLLTSQYSKGCDKVIIKPSLSLQEPTKCPVFCSYYTPKQGRPQPAFRLLRGG